MPDDSPGDAVAVLVSGGIDSAILCVDLLRRGSSVFPLYVRFGLRWEAAEFASLKRFLKSIGQPGLRPVHVLDEPIADVYGAHWSTGQSGVPDATTPDEAVYLPGRNLLLVAKAAIWCSLRGLDALALGCLRSNPFPDSTPEFFRGFEATINRALGGRLRLLRPFDQLPKSEVLRRGAGLPLQHTFSCLDPVGDRHCGACNKCAERQRGFRALGWPDHTPYAARPAEVR